MTSMNYNNGLLKFKAGRNSGKKAGLFLALLLLTGTVAQAAAGGGILPNTGRLDDQVGYYLSNGRADVFFTSNSVTIDLRDPANAGKLRAVADDPALPLPTFRGHALQLNFPGSAPDPRLIPGDVLSSRTSFFMGDDPAQWQSNVPSYDSVTYRNLWPGIDLVFRLGDTGLEYELILAEGADPSLADFQWLGADSTRETATGRELGTAFGTLLVTTPTIDKSGAGTNGTIDLFESTGPVDKASINALLWSTLIGGSGDDVGSTLALASNGDVFIAGETQSPNFPTTPGVYDENVHQSLDMFISRFANEGSELVWSSFIGTSTIEYLNAITLDASDNPTVGGRTYASNFPVTAGAFQTSANGGQDAVVVKLSADGTTLLYGSYLGGSEVDSVFDLQTDASGNLVIAGYTASSDYPTTLGCYQDFFAGPPYDFIVSTLSADFSTLVTSTYIGGTDRDACRSVAIDANGDLLLAGFSFSTDWPVTAGVFQEVKSGIDDAALAKMSPDLTTLIWSTFIGGSGSERSLAIDLDSLGNPVITGYTQSSNFPTTSGAFQETYGNSEDAFVSKFNNTDGTLQWSTFLGGSFTDHALSVMVDSSDNPLVTGYTSSTNFPVNASGFDETHNGNYDVFVTRLLNDGSDLLWSTFLGGAGSDSGLELVLDANDNPIVTGETASTDFPVSTWAYDTTPNGANDGFLTRFDTGNAHLELTTADDLVSCGQATDVAVHFVPDLPHTPPLRGYSIRIIAPAGVTFTEADITVLSPLVDVSDTSEIVENALGDYTIDFSFLDAGAGLTTAADLFTVTVHGDAEGVSVMAITSALFRDEDNHPFDVDYNNTLDITVDCTPPPVPTLAAEPGFTAGIVNTISWSDESAGGAIMYNVQVSTIADFSVVDDESGWIAGLSHEFTGLLDTVTYFYRVAALGGNSLESAWSASETSTQDTVDPVTSVDALPPLAGITFDVPYTGTDSGSGLASVDLFVAYEGGPWTSFGNFTASPIAFSPGSGDGTYGFYTVGIDSAGNVETTPGAAQATVVVDTQGPIGSFTINDGAIATNDSSVVLNMTVTDALDMRFSNDNVDFPAGWATYATEQAWEISGTEGDHIVFGEFRDDAGNILAVQDTINFDATAPEPASFLVVDMGHQAISLTWHNPDDTDQAGVMIWRGLLHDGANATAYPQYTDAVVPTAPVSPDSALVNPEWTLAGIADSGAEAFVDSVSTRGVYYYEVFVLDHAGNSSGPAGTLPRATNYLLGDIYLPFNGDVDVADITTLGSTYGLADGHVDFNADADVGPTHNNAGDGIPQPDDVIDFQDLMISALNFDLPAKSGDHTPAKADAGPVALAWRQRVPGTWELELSAPHPSFKGLEIKGDLPDGTTPLVSAGQLLDDQENPVFLRNIDGHGLETGLALLGTGLNITGQGHLLTLQLSNPAAAFDPSDLTLTLRDVDNQDLQVEFGQVSAVDLPTVFALERNFPNPFNPSTTISFSLPAASDVRLEVFSLDGKRVAVLVNETMAAGRHQSVWTGRDESGRAVATGIYFYRISAGSFNQVEKMTLLK